MNRQKGFAHVEALVLTLVLVVMVASGVWVYSKQRIVDGPASPIPTASKKAAEQKPTTTSDTSKAKQTAQDTPSTYVFSELGVSITLLPGWSVSKIKDDTGVSYEATSASSPLSISAFVSKTPAGFEGCINDDSMTSLTVNLLKPTHISGLFVYSDTANGLMITKGNVKFASTTKSLKASTIQISSLEVGSSYFFCRGDTPPLAWDVDFDNNTSNEDGVFVLDAQRNPDSNEISAKTVGYQDVVTMLETLTH